MTSNIGQFPYSLLPLLFGPLCNKQSLVVYSCSGVSDLHVFHSHRWRMELACGDMRTWGIHAGCPILTTRKKNTSKSELKFKIKTHSHKTCWLQHGNDGNILIPCFRYCCERKWFRGYFNPSNSELNPICHFLALLGAHCILHISKMRVKRIVYVSFLWQWYTTKFQSILHTQLQW